MRGKNKLIFIYFWNEKDQAFCNSLKIKYMLSLILKKKSKHEAYDKEQLLYAYLCDVRVF